MSKSITFVSLLLALVLEYAFVADSYLPTAHEAVENLGGYLRIVGLLVWLVGLSALLTEHRLKYRICAILTGLSMPILVVAYAFMTRW